MTIKYKEVEMNEEDIKDAIFNRDKTKVQLEVLEFNLKSYKKELDLRIPQRNLEQRLKENQQKMEEQLALLKENLKVYEKQVRTKKKEVPESYEKDK